MYIPPKLKEKILKRFHVYDSRLFPLLIQKVSLYKRLMWVLQRSVLYTFYGKTNRVFSVKFKGLKDVKCRSFHTLLGELRHWGLWETELQNTFLEYLPKSKCFVDIGSMEGFYSIIARTINPSCAIMMVEPGEGAKPLIRENLRLNGMDINGDISFNDKFIGATNNENTLTLGELLKESPDPIFILIDIDGQEMNVLESSMDFLKTRDAVVLVETHSRELEMECLNLFSVIGFEALVIRNSWWRYFIPEERPIALNRWILARRVNP